MKLKYKLIGMVCFGVLLSSNPVFVSVGDGVNKHNEVVNLNNNVDSHYEFARMLKKLGTKDSTLSSYVDSDNYIVIKERYHGPSRDIQHRSIVKDMPEGFSVLDFFNLNELSELTGVSIEEILEIKDNGKRDFDLSMVASIEARNFGTWDESRPTVGIDNIRNLVFPGDIHLTPQGRTLGFQHGHAALAYNSEFNIEILGVGHFSDKISKNGWGNYNAYRMYYTPKLFLNEIRRVAEYADNNLLGRPYVAIAYIDSRSHVNCATLVWKAFHDSGYLTMRATTLAPFSLQT